MNWNWNPENTPPKRVTTEDLSVFKTEKTRKSEITEGMSPKEISEVVSDHLINIIRKQFEEGKKQFLQGNTSHTEAS